MSTITSTGVPRRILGFEPGEPGEWVARLECAHRRHVRHRPPLSNYAWVESAEGRAAHLGEPIECGRCLQRVWPEGVVETRATPEFDEASTPAGLLGTHTTKAGTWGRLEVLEGRLTLSFEAPLDERVSVSAGESAAIPPELPHRVVLDGAVRFRVRFFRAGG
jgi:tellurite methyltransferase